MGTGQVGSYNDARSVAWLRESVCAILLYDITSRASFEKVTDADFFAGIKAKMHPQSSFIVLIGNKMDLAEL